MGISQPRILEWTSISFYKGSSQPRHQTPSPALVGVFSTTEPTKRWIQKDTVQIYVRECLGMFSTRSFIISSFIFGSLNHFEFTFVYSNRECSSFINVLIHYHLCENKSLTEWAIGILLSGGVAK